MKPQEVVSLYNWTEGVCSCSSNCETKNRTFHDIQCCIDFDSFCLDQGEINTSHFDTILQSIGLRHAHLIYIMVGILGVSLLAFSLKLYYRQIKPLTMKKICEDIKTGSLLEMTSSGSLPADHQINANNDHMLHWDEIYNDFVDFNLAEEPDKPNMPANSFVSLYSNTISDYDLSYFTNERRENISLVDSETATEGSSNQISGE